MSHAFQWRANRRTWIAALAGAAAVSCSAIILGQAEEAPAKAAVRFTVQLADSNPGKRAEAFYALIGLGSKGEKGARVGPALAALLQEIPESADAVKLALIRTLETENRLVDAENRLAEAGNQPASGRPALTEEYTDYYGDLITAVTWSRDARSIRALSGAMGTGHMVIRTLSSFGEAAVEPVLEKLRSEGLTRPDKQAACIILGLFLDPANPNRVKDPKAREKIRRTLEDELKKAAQDAGGAYLRAAAAEGLAKVGGAGSVSSFLSGIAGKEGERGGEALGRLGILKSAEPKAGPGKAPPR